jgi:hypothetical protein
VLCLTGWRRSVYIFKTNMSCALVLPNSGCRDWSCSGHDVPLHQYSFASTLNRSLRLAICASVAPCAAGVSTGMSFVYVEAQT